MHHLSLGKTSKSRTTMGGVKRFFSKFRGGRPKFCSTSDDQIVDGSFPTDGAFPVNTERESTEDYYKHNMSMSSEIEKGDVDELDQIDSFDNSRRNMYCSEFGIRDEEDGVHDSDTTMGLLCRPVKKSKSRFSMRFVRSRLFEKEKKRNSDLKLMEEGVVFDSSPEERTQPSFASGEPFHHGSNSNNNNNSNSSQNPSDTEKKQVSEKDVNPLFKRTFSPPPVLDVLEVIGLKRTRSDVSDVSNVSSLSGTRDHHHPLEFSLTTGIRDGSPFMVGLTEDIMRKRKTQFIQQVYDRNSPTRHRGSLPKCLVLLTDPRRRIFEIVPIPYNPETSTVEDILNQVPKIATDHRLKYQMYTGIAFRGVHIGPSLIPTGAILDGVSRGQPLLAVPKNYTAPQLEMIAENLLQSPSVKRLLNEQLAGLEMTSNATRPLQDKTHDVMTRPPHHRIDSAGFIACSDGFSQQVFCS